MKKFKFDVSKFFTLVGVLLCLAKLSGLVLVNVSWWWITSPFWVPTLVFIGFMVSLFGFSSMGLPSESVLRSGDESYDMIPADESATIVRGED